MTWTAPLTAVLNATLTAAQWNIHIRDNLNETEAAKATTMGGIMTVSATNQIAERLIKSSALSTANSTTSTSYTNLYSLGPSVNVTTGAKALVMFSAGATNSGLNGQSAVSVGVSGATTIAPIDDWAIIVDGITAGTLSDNFIKRSSAHLFTTLTPGSNTFYMQYKAGSGTGYFYRREIIVWAM